VFTVVAGSHTISFQGLDSAGGDNTAFVDAVALTQPQTQPPPPPPAPVALGDSGFEAPALGSGTFGDFQYAPAGTPWTFAGNAGISGNGSGFTAGNPNAPEGTQVAFLQTTGSFSQSLNLAAGTYRLGFAAAQRGNIQASAQTFRVLVDGLAVGTFTPAGTSYSAFTTDAFTVAAGAHTIQFVGLNPQGGDNTAFIDNVQLSR
jgi:hypothetical protein